MTTKDPGALDVEVGRRIKAFRLRKGLPQQKLADRLGVTSRQIRQYENGVDHIGVRRLQAVADILGVQILDFFSWAGLHRRAGGCRRRAW